VLQLLVGRERPVSAQQLHTELRATGSRIGLTTIYRALQALAAAGLLHAFGWEGETAYRFCGQDLHHHLVCRVCGLVAEGPPIPGIEDWLAEVSAERDFTPERHRVEVRGVCGACT
jgi:Fur family ferric uptake transcriptional regulator